MKCYAFCGAICVLVLGASAIKYTDCGSTTGQVTDVKISGCEGKDVCPLKRGSDAQITINFTSKTDSSQLKAVVHGVIESVPLPFNLPQPDACQGSGVSCPIKKGSNYVYNKSLAVKSSYPPLSVQIKWELKDQQNVDVACVMIPSKIE